MDFKEKKESFLEATAPKILTASETANPMEVVKMCDRNGAYGKNVAQSVERYKKKFPGDFYLVGFIKEKRMPSIGVSILERKRCLSLSFWGRYSCPTPDYRQIVYRYHRKDDKLEFLWVIPDRYTCITYSTNRAIIDKSEWGLLKYVLEFLDGTLLQRAQVLNNEI